MRPRLGNILREFEAGLIDWHSAAEELEALGVFDDDLVRVLGPCPMDERTAYAEDADA